MMNPDLTNPEPLDLSFEQLNLLENVSDDISRVVNQIKSDFRANIKYFLDNGNILVGEEILAEAFQILENRIGFMIDLKESQLILPTSNAGFKVKILPEITIFYFRIPQPQDFDAFIQNLSEDKSIIERLIKYIAKVYNNISGNNIDPLSQIEEGESHFAYISRKFVSQKFWVFVEQYLHDNYLVTRLNKKGLHYDRDFSDSNGNQWYYKVKLIYRPDHKKRISRDGRHSDE